MQSPQCCRTRAAFTTSYFLLSTELFAVSLATCCSSHKLCTFELHSGVYFSALFGISLHHAGIPFFFGASAGTAAAGAAAAGEAWRGIACADGELLRSGSFKSL